MVVTCRELAVSWGLIFIGIGLFALYPSHGVLVAFLPFAIAGYLRGSHDAHITETVLRRGKWQGFLLVYYLVVFALATRFADRVFDVSVIVPLAVIVFPLFIAMISYDVSVCRSRGNPP